MEVTDADFGGWATKVGLRCTDGRTIMKDAFLHQDRTEVPLVWQHSHNDPTNVLGHAILENRAEGVYAYAFFNDSPNGEHVKKLVQHGDVKSLSIYANQLKERNQEVFHGQILELSVVLAGANSGAKIDQVRIAHSDGSVQTLDDEAIIHTGIEIEGYEAEEDNDVSHAQKTIADVLATLDEEQTTAVNFVLGAALEEQKASLSVKHTADDGTEVVDDAPVVDASTDTESTDTESKDTVSDDQNDSKDAPSDEKNDAEGNLAHMEGTTSMTRNVFDQNGSTGGATQGATLSHDSFTALMENAKKLGSFKEAVAEGLKPEGVLAHATNAAGDTVTYGVADLDWLFPEAKLDSAGLQVHSRRMEWVQTVLDGTKKLPFSKVRTLIADITADEARAKGYVKGTRKKEEVITLLRRSTGPATIYKKQKLDRDDIIDIGNDMDIVAWLKVEIRMMLEEELARAILVGDGRSNLDDDKIKDPAGAVDGNGIRSVLKDDDFYSIKARLAPNTSPKDMVKGVVRARSKFRGSGKPTLFISDEMLTDIMLEEDKFGRSLYETEQSLADKLRVSSIVTVDVFNEYEDLMAIMVNLADYSIGTNRGGELTSFEDFDIDFNQHKYLQETRLSGGLNKPLSAIVILRATGTLATATAPSFDGVTNTITIPTATGVVYEGNGVPLASGDVVISETTEVEAVPDEGFYFSPNSNNTWTYTYTP